MSEYQKMKTEVPEIFRHEYEEYCLYERESNRKPKNFKDWLKAGECLNGKV